MHNNTFDSLYHMFYLCYNITSHFLLIKYCNTINHHYNKIFALQCFSDIFFPTMSRVLTKKLELKKS